MKKMKLLLRFPSDRMAKPVSSHLIRDYDLDFNILSAHINAGMTGELTIELIGEDKNLDDGVQFLKDEGIAVSMLSRTIEWVSDKCTHCGACTAVCPSGALSLDSNAELSFDQDKCLVCELCIAACPLKVLAVNYALDR
jgi:L-aspartate semialdehyde sulfurtransferase ferredoxin